MILGVVVAAGIGAEPSEAELAASRVTVPTGMVATLWAAEPLLANPVAMAFDEQGRAYIVETTRFKNGVPDTRDHMQWLDEDLACRSVDDRLAMYRRHKYAGFEKYDDQVRQVWDSSGRGRADTSRVFIKGFNQPQDGLAAGVLARKGAVYVTNIPNLYLLKDHNDDGVADEKQILSSGYGVRAQFVGHDLHGLRMGPDGRLYFTIGDRGLNVVTREGKRLWNPDSGAVLRCEPDGRNLEIIHIGLRNPQELAFDDFGNLFTWDNNSDSGDHARWVHVVPGGDSGWRCGFQYGTYYHTPAVKQGNRGPWNSEGIWRLAEENHNAWIVPPLAHFGSGPSGITHYPGVGLPERYQDHFFACDFTSGAVNSAIWSLAVRPKGASFEVVDLHRFVRNMLPTDCEFGPDGALYWCDWVAGWNPPGKGRIFRVTDPAAMTNPAVSEAQRLIRDGFGGKNIDELLKTLSHPHFQVRQESQYEIAVRPYEDVVPRLATLLRSDADVTAKRHAIWALGQIYRAHSADSTKGEPIELVKLINHPDVDLRCQVINALGDCASSAHSSALRKHLRSPEPRVQFAAALALARIAKCSKLSLDADILTFADKVGDDPWLRHAAVMLLACCDPTRVPDKLSKNQRLVFALALRRLGGPVAEQRLKKLLHDPEPNIAIEAARAIYDERMTGALTALATHSSKLEPIAFRVLAANFFVGGPESARRLAAFAAKASEPEYLRATALKLLADWPDPPRRDPITGLALSLPVRDAEEARAALGPVLTDLVRGGDAVRSQAVDCVKRLKVQGVGRVLAKLTSDHEAPDAVRAQALLALHELEAPELDAAVNEALVSAVARLRAAARQVRARREPNTVLAELPSILSDPAASIAEKQMAFGEVARLGESADADRLLAEWLDRLIAGQVMPELRLELLEACEARLSKRVQLHADLRGKLTAYFEQVKSSGKRHSEALAGGDAERGREIFQHNSAVACQRCHKLDGEGGDVGPPVNGLGRDKSREYLLESLVAPNAQIAEGYASVILELSDGRKVSGVLRKKSPEKYVLLSAENKVLEVAAGDVERERTDRSAMPEDAVQKLSRRELRDLVEFLATLQDKK